MILLKVKDKDKAGDMSLFGRLLAILLPSVALLRDQEGVVDRALAHARRVGCPVSRGLF